MPTALHIAKPILAEIENIDFPFKISVLPVNCAILNHHKLHLDRWIYTTLRWLQCVLKIAFNLEKKIWWCLLHSYHHSHKLFCKPNMLAAIPSHL